MSFSSQPNPLEILKREYSSKQIEFEFKQAFEKTLKTMPLFTKCLLVVRFTLYCLSWFSSAPNKFMLADFDLMFG